MAPFGKDCYIEIKEKTKQKVNWISFLSPVLRLSAAHSLDHVTAQLSTGKLIHAVRRLFVLSRWMQATCLVRRIGSCSRRKIV